MSSRINRRGASIVDYLFLIESQATKFLWNNQKSAIASTVCGSALASIVAGEACIAGRRPAPCRETWQVQRVWRQQPVRKLPPASSWGPGRLPTSPCSSSPAGGGFSCLHHLLLHALSSLRRWLGGSPVHQTAAPECSC